MSNYLAISSLQNDSVNTYYYAYKKWLLFCFDVHKNLLLSSEHQ